MSAFREALQTRISALIAGVITSLLPVLALAAPVLLISIDGLRPGDLLEADKRGIKAPALRALATPGLVDELERRNDAPLRAKVAALLNRPQGWRELNWASPQWSARKASPPAAARARRCFS